MSDLLPPSLGGLTVSELTGSGTLILKCRDISEADCDILSALLLENRSLERLYLGYNRVGDRGAALLCKNLAKVKNGQLLALGFQDCQLGNAAAIAIADLIAKNRTISSIQLSDNAIGDDGIDAIAGAIAANATLERLVVGGNNFSESAYARLQSVKPHQLVVTMSSSNFSARRYDSG